MSKNELWQMSVLRKWFNTLRPRHSGRHFADSTFKCVLWDENIGISINIYLNFVPKGQIGGIPALVQMIDWRRPGDKPLSDPVMVRLPMHICVTSLQWVKAGQWWNLICGRNWPTSETCIQLYWLQLSRGQQVALNCWNFKKFTWYNALRV